MLFNNICTLLEKLGKTSKRIEKTLILRDFIKNKDLKEVGILLDILSGAFHREIGKKEFNISTKTVLDAISLAYEAPIRKLDRELNKTGDLGKVAQGFFKKKQTFATSELTLKKITEGFQKITNIKGESSQHLKKEILVNLFLKAQNELEAKYLARIIINDLRIGVAEGILRESLANVILANVLNVNLVCEKCLYINLSNETCFNCGNIIKKDQSFVCNKYNVQEFKRKEDLIDHQFVTGGREVYNIKLEIIERKYNLINSFQELIKEISDDKLNLFKYRIILGRPIKSMLGIRVNTLKEAIKTVGKPYLADFKYDGLRMQIHKQGNNIWIFTRNLEDITDKFPEVKKYFKENFEEDFVLDCEGVGYDYNTQKYIEFQKFSKRFQSKELTKVGSIRITIRAFDILYLNGETLIERPYKERREILNNLFLNKPLKQPLYFTINKLHSKE